MTFALLTLVVALALPASEASSADSHRRTTSAARAAQTPQDDRPEIAARCKELDEALDTHGKEDARAIELVTKLGTEAAALGPKDKDRIAKLLGRALVDPRKQPEKGKFEDRLARAAAKTLGSLGEQGARELAAGVDAKTVQKNGPLVEEVLAELGRTQAKKAVEVLADNAGVRSVFCVRGAARGMAFFAESDQPTRKKLFEALFKPMMSMADEARGEGTTAAYLAKDVFEGARDASYVAFETLAKHEEPDIDAWQRWWNKNKAADWSKPSK